MTALRPVEFDDKQTIATISIDKKVYSKPAVLRACYWFSKDLYFQINEKEDHFQVTIGLRDPTPTLNHPRVKQIDEWLPEVFDALLDSQLRVDIQTETAAVRELIIAKAFAESGVLEDSPPGIFEDPVSSGGLRSDGLVKITDRAPD